MDVGAAPRLSGRKKETETIEEEPAAGGDQPPDIQVRKQGRHAGTKRARRRIMDLQGRAGGGTLWQ